MNESIVTTYTLQCRVHETSVSVVDQAGREVGISFLFLALLSRRPQFLGCWLFLVFEHDHRMVVVAVMGWL